MGESRPGPLAVFLSYRSNDTGELAEQVAQSLKRDLGVGAVYYAPTDNQPYDDWHAEIEKHLRESDVVVTLIGPDWANCPPGRPDGTCVHHEDDWVRREVVAALNNDAMVILPVLVRGGSLSAASASASTCSRGESVDQSVLSDLGRVHGISLDDESESSVDYQRLLATCWLGLRTIDDRTIIVVEDGSDEAKVQLEELARALIAEDLVEASTLSQLVNEAAHTHAITLRKAAKRWPEVIVLAPRTPSEVLLARGRAFAEVRGVKEVGLLGAGAVGVQAGLVDAFGSGMKATLWESPKQLVSSLKAGWWKSLSVGPKFSLATASTVVVVAGAVAAGVLLPGPTGECATGEEQFLNIDNIAVQEGLNTSGTLNNTVTLDNVIDAPAADAVELHTQESHVWHTGPQLELVFDLQRSYCLRTMHFWNYPGEAYDVDEIELAILDDGGREVARTAFQPAIGVGLATESEDFPIGVEGARLVLATITGTNSESDFQNIAFTAVAPNG